MDKENNSEKGYLEQGVYQYRYFENYFFEKNRKALFINYCGCVAGFVLINDYSVTEEVINYFESIEEYGR